MIARKLKLGKVVEGVHDTSRGLEVLLDARLSDFCYQMKENTMRAVLNEQHNQREQHGKIVSTALISFVYQINGSEQCQEVACVVGQEDFVESSNFAEYVSSTKNSYEY